MIRSFASNYTKPENCTVETVQVLDFATLTMNMIEANAQYLGIKAEDTYNLRMPTRWNSLVAQLCASLPFPDENKGCLPNYFSNDGIHWCPETTHGRLNAGLVCILSCIYNDKSMAGMDTCCNNCNSKFMSLEPLVFENGQQILE
mmetsp:Transcript_49821/g.149848  ORF Transcript_49821/g.149848 Transcript_49821/m.149848 type:complete len:145 (-) Transcript_49821:203-637(-)